MSAASDKQATSPRGDPGFLKRTWAMVVKEFVQMRRDRMTFATMIFIPILQLVLFGYAINTDPKHLPTAVLTRDDGPLTRAVLTAMKNSDYFEFVAQVRDPAEIDRMLASGEVQFAVEVPASFERDIRRGDRPSLLVIADATDPVATGTAISAVQGLVDTALKRELRGPDDSIEARAPPFKLTLQRRYNPEGLTQYNIVPGLLGVVLTMTMMMFTALAVTREIERGTMESLLAMPIKPVEIMIGKIAPFVLVGFVQMAIIISAAHFMFGVPILGQRSPLDRADDPVRRSQSRRGLYFLHHRREPTSGGAAHLLLLPAEHSLVGFHVPVSRHAALGAVDRRGAAAHPFHAHRARHHAQGKRLRRDAGSTCWRWCSSCVVAMGLALLRFRRTLD